MKISPEQVIDDRYRVIEKLGEGGMGAVWKAVDAKHGDEVVIKMPLYQNDPKILKRFAREAQAMRKFSLECPHILNIEDLGELQGMPWYVMRFLPGGSVADRVLPKDSSGAVQWDENSFGWVGHIAAALDYLHKKQAYHRDVKPDNILFSSEGTPYLVDFGIVKTVNETTSMMTDQGTAIGTMAYMAPEILEGHPFTAQSDQYSLAVTLYEYLTGERPYSGTTFFTLFKSLQKGHRKLSELFPAIPKHASDAVDRALSTEGSERFGSCSEFTTTFMSGLVEPENKETPPTQNPPENEEDETREVDLQTYKKSVASNANTPNPVAEKNLAGGNPFGPGDVIPTEVVSPVRASQPQAPRPPKPPGKAAPKKSRKLVLFGTLAAILLAGAVYLGVYFDWQSLSIASNDDSQQVQLQQAEEQRAAEERAEEIRLRDEREAQFEIEREEDRLEAERKQKLRIAAAAKAEEDRLAEEKLAEEKLEAEKRAAEKIAADKLAAEQRAEEERRAEEIRLAQRQREQNNAQSSASKSNRPVFVATVASANQQQAFISEMIESSGFGEMNTLIKTQLDSFTQGLNKNLGAGVMFYNNSEGTFDFLAFVPVEDIDDLLDMASQFLVLEEEGDLIKIFDSEDEYVAKQIGGYVFVSNNQTLLEQNKVLPSSILNWMPKNYKVAVRALPGQLTLEMKQNILDQIAAGVKETEGADEALIESQMLQFKSLLEDTEMATFGLTDGSGGKGLLLDLTMKAKPGSDIALWSQARKKPLRTKFGGFSTPNEVFKFHILDRTIPSYRVSSIAMVDQFLDTLFEGLEVDYPSLDLDNLSAISDRISKGFKDTIEAGVLDAAGVMDDGTNFVAGARVSNAAEFEAAFKDLFDAIEVADGRSVLFNGSIGGIRTQEIVLPVPENEKEFRELWGEEVKVIVGVANETIYFAVGKAPHSCLLYTSPSPRDGLLSRMPSSA